MDTFSESRSGNGVTHPPDPSINFDDFAAGRREYAETPGVESFAPTPTPSVKPFPDELILEGAATLTAFGIPTVEGQEAYEQQYKAFARPLLKMTRLGEALAEYGIGMNVAGGEGPAWLRIAMAMGGLAGIAYMLRWPERLPPQLVGVLATLGMQQAQTAQAPMPPDASPPAPAPEPSQPETAPAEATAREDHA